MTKTYRVDIGFDVRKGDKWYGAGRLVTINDDESIEIYAAPHGNRGERVAVHSYDSLVRDRPPTGLGRV